MGRGSMHPSAIVGSQMMYVEREQTGIVYAIWLDEAVRYSGRQ